MMWRRPRGLGVWIGPWHSIRGYGCCWVLLWPWWRGGSWRSGVPGVRESSLPLVRELDLILRVKRPEATFAFLLWSAVYLDEGAM